MSNLDPTAFVVDHDPVSRDSIRGIVESAAFNAETFDAAPAFLAAFTPHRHGCLILASDLPGLTGLDLMRRLDVSTMTIPTIVVSRGGDVTTAVAAMHAGALTVLERPVVREQLLDWVREAVAQDRRRRAKRRRVKSLDKLFARLTPREREVMGLVVRGKPNKEVAGVLGRSEKTIEFHRAQIMKKMEVGSFAELVRLDQERSFYADRGAVAVTSGEALTRQSKTDDAIEQEV